MTDQDVLAERFEENRTHLQQVALRMLGSPAEADDAVQQAWLRLSRTNDDGIDNLGGWLTTVVSRVCLDMLRSRAARREDASPVEADAPLASAPAAAVDPETRAMMADAIGPALLLVLDELSPAERLAFVLHDTFDVPFDEIGPIVGRTPAAARQLASRARRRVRGGVTPAVDRERQRAVVDAFLAAAHEGDFERLITLLAPDAVMRADAAAVATGAPGELVGPDAVAGMFSGRALGATVAVIDGSVGLMWAVGGTPRVFFEITLDDDDRIVSVDMAADPTLLDGAVVAG